MLIERAPERRKGGYFIGLFGTGKASASWLGVLDTLVDRSSPMMATYEIDRANHRTKGMSFVDAPGAPLPLLRGDVENSLFDALPKEVEVRFATVPTRIEQDERGVDVSLTHKTSGTSTTEHPTLLFSYRVEDVAAQFRGRPIDSLRKAYGPEKPGSVLSHLLNEFEAADERLFDSTNHVRMPSWHKGRVVLG